MTDYDRATRYIANTKHTRPFYLWLRLLLARYPYVDLTVKFYKHRDGTIRNVELAATDWVKRDEEVGLWWSSPGWYQAHVGPVDAAYKVF